MNRPTPQSPFGRSGSATGKSARSAAWASRSSRRGSALLAALCFASVLALAASSYITLCYRTLELSSRSVQSTRSVELAETGMEEALWAINNSNWSGWSISGTTATKTVTGFTYDNNVTGDIHLTVTSYNSSADTRTVTATGTTHNPNGADLSRTLTSTSTKASLFVNAIAGTTGPVIFINGGTADSYNSAAGTYASQTPTYSAIIASTAPATSSATVQLVNAQIKGYGTSLYSHGPSYSTGGRIYGPSTPTTTKIDRDRISTSPYQPLFDIRTITAPGTDLANPALNSTTTIGRRQDTVPKIYYATWLDLMGETKIVVDGPVRLVVSGSLYIGLCCGDPAACTACYYGGAPSIEVTSYGTLEVFVAGDIAIYGNGINNLTLNPQRVAIYGTNTYYWPDIHTLMPFYGVIYTPTGTFNVRGNSTIYGAIVARQVNFTGTTPVIHYDLNLRNTVFAGVETPFGIYNWRETTNGM